MCYHVGMAKPKTEFLINQTIVYPSQGVGKVIDVFKREFKGEMVYHYKIYIEVSDMNVIVPVENAKALGIRAIVTKQEAKKALDSISDDYEPPTSDWKLRYQQNLDLLKKGTIGDIAAIVRCLYHRSKVKELPILERKLYENAKTLLENEIAEAYGITPKEVEVMLHAKLEPLGLKIEKKPTYTEDDEEEDEFEEDTSTSKEDDDDDDED